MACATEVRVLPRIKSVIHASVIGMRQKTPGQARYMAKYCRPKLSIELPMPSSTNPRQPTPAGTMMVRSRRP